MLIYIRLHDKSYTYVKGNTEERWERDCEQACCDELSLTSLIKLINQLIN